MSCIRSKRLTCSPARATDVRRFYDPEDRIGYGVGSITLYEDDLRRMQSESPTQGPTAWTYGEVAPDSVEQLGKAFGFPGTRAENAVFYDLGSGFGRLTLQAFCDWGVRRAVGVELSERRHSRAEAALERFRASASAPRDLSGVSFVRANLLEVELHTATDAYLACTCWDEPFVRAALAKLRSECGALETVALTESLEAEYGIDPAEYGLQLERSLALKMT
eukprot:CAMPEP_0170151698 /NCGR_PEP_ID=MMETSP0033_2-20121228/50311_1 /TAXON_ID=195969 /ORGANISM="Dolichomastix tenuilepis, Strain CCMP3274" /LENGTH=220 /DNA_ID=CAMNT_0010388801 /DNA_START=1 /DNA_END=660 /DNA_ORIENTATION=-